MAANAVGNLSVKLQLDAAQFQAALQGAGVDIRQFANSTVLSSGTTRVMTAQTTKASVATHALSSILNQASFGAADFASQLSTRGLGGALQAASNNIQVMGAAFGPWGLGISAATGLAVQALGSYIEFQERAAKVTEDSAKRRIAAEKAASETLSKLMNDRQFAQDLRGATAFNVDNAETIQNRISTLQQQRDERNAQRRDLQKQLFAQLPEISRNFSFEEAVRGGMLENFAQTIGRDGMAAMPMDRAAVAVDLAGKLRELTQKGITANLEQNTLQQLLPERRRQEMLDSNRDEQKKGDVSALEQRNKLRAEGDAIRRRFETDGERKLREFNELSLARSLGQITESEFLAFGKQALKDDKLSPTGANSKMAGAFDFGSPEAMSAINKALRMNPTERDAKKTADESAKTTEQLRKANESLRKMEQGLRENQTYTGTISF